MKRKILSGLLAALLLFSALPVPFAFAVDVWDGVTQEEPETADGVYQISNGAQLAWFASHVNEQAALEEGLVNIDAVLTADIDLGGHAWTPIGNTSYVVYTYSGTFDGDYHTIDGLSVDASSANYGLFGVVNGATIKNLSVNGVLQSTHVLGGIVGKLQTGTLENCAMSGRVTTTGTSSKGYVGGLVGTVGAAGAVFSGCANTADVSGAYAGGIVGYNTKKATIKNCYNTGTITGTTRAGGIAGQQQSGEIAYCYNSGSSASGICGFSSAEMTACFYRFDETTPHGGTASGGEKFADARSLLDLLNSGADKAFAEDTAGVNGGYPILKWQVKEMPAVPVASVSIRGEAVTGSTLIADAHGADGQDATDPVFCWAISEDGADFVPFEDAVSGACTIPDTEEYVGKLVRVQVFGADGSSAFAVVGPIERSADLTHRQNTARVEAAANALTLAQTDIRSSGKIDLPKVFDGCTVVWTSSRPDLIDADGTVVLPEKNIVSVTLTARLLFGDAETEKKFTVNVWSENIDPDVYLNTILDSLRWDFKLLQPVCGEDTNILVKLCTLLAKRGFDGVTVTIRDTADESLIARNGKIFYPELPEEGSFAQGRQVKVSFLLTVGDAEAVYPQSDIYALLIPWNTDAIAARLQQAADEKLTERALCAPGDTFASITEDMTLPSCIEGEKYAFAWIDWTSSDPQILSVSNENRTSGADSLYRPFVGSVHRDGASHEVTLTARIEEPSGGTVLTRVFSVTVAPEDGETLIQTLDTMQALLDCYTADKLLRFGTTARLDTAAVDSDIQLIIPKNVVTDEEREALAYGPYWDYWNYRFTVESSDPDVIEINAFRAYVYRPLGEDSTADRDVTLTVTMTSRTTPGLSVSKELPLTVKHLSRAEIDEALGLMDDALTHYADGLLGANADAYSIIDDLTPYKEIDRDGSGVSFVYRYDEMTNTGIVVDELPDWETQEDWRLFRSSDRDLLANETLAVNAAPQENRFVKVNSVLTHEVFGKYYLKFRDDPSYDRETLVKFEQLYKQPVSAYFMLPGSDCYTADFAGMTVREKQTIFAPALAAYKAKAEEPIVVTFTLLGLDDEVLIPETVVDGFTRGATVFDVFKKVLADYHMEFQAKGSYVSQIGGLAAFDHGRNSGWMYTVDTVYVSSYMNAQALDGGEAVIVRYVRDYTTANDDWKEPEQSLLQRIIDWFRALFRRIRAIFDSVFGWLR